MSFFDFLHWCFSDFWHGLVTLIVLGCVGDFVLKLVALIVLKRWVD